MRTINHRWPPASCWKRIDGQLQPVLTVKDAASFLGWSESQVRRHLKLLVKGRRVFISSGTVYQASGKPQG